MALFKLFIRQLSDERSHIKALVALSEKNFAGNNISIFFKI